MMSEPTWVATRVVIDETIEGPKEREIIMVRRSLGPGSERTITIPKPVFDKHEASLTVGSVHSMRCWTNSEFSGSGRFRITAIREGRNALGESSVEIDFEDVGPFAVLASASTT